MATETVPVGGGEKDAEGQKVTLPVRGRNWDSDKRHMIYELQAQDGSMLCLKVLAGTADPFIGATALAVEKVAGDNKYLIQGHPADKVDGLPQ